MAERPLVNVRSAAVLAGIAFLLLFPRPARAKWERIANFRGGPVTAFAARDGILFLSTREAGVFLSTDQGATWRAANRGLPPDAKILYLIARGADLLAGTSEHGVFLSANNGGWWKAVNAGLAERAAVRCLAASGPEIVAGTSAGAFRTPDSGARWMSMNEGFPQDAGVRCLAVAGSSLVAGTSAGVFMTSGGGAWAAVGEGLPEGVRIDCLVAVGPDIYAGSELHGVFRLTAGSGRWEPVNKGIPETEIHCLAAEDGHLLAGTGGGTSFHIGDLSKDQLAWMYHGPGVFLSGDGGMRWKPVNSGLRRAPAALPLEKMLDLWIERLAVCGPYLFAGTQNGEIWRLPLADLN